VEASPKISPAPTASSAVVSAPAASSVTASNIPSKPFLLADIGEGIAEVELMSWYVKMGDKVKAFDKICEVQSDKATVEITSRYDGLVTAVHHNVGDIVKVSRRSP
jgi:2-oxoisovalerate dehydrogenase E2 component (dihydrolipoyl transacylase)